MKQKDLGFTIMFIYLFLFSEDTFGVVNFVQKFRPATQ